MSSRFEIQEVLSAIDNFWENRELHKKDPDLAYSFVDKLKKMEVWFIGMVFIDNSMLLRSVAGLCQNGPQNDARKFMAFARYSFRQLGPQRFENCINRSSLTARRKRIIIECFRIGEINHALSHDISNAADAMHKGTSKRGIFLDEPIQNAL